MGRVYSVSFENVSVAALQDFFEITPVADKPVAIHGFCIGQTGVADVGEAQEENLRLQIIRGHATTGSGGSTATPIPMNPNDTAAGDTTVEINNTTIASAGTAVVLATHTMNVRSGIDMFYPPELRPQASFANTLLVLRLLANPADAITLSGTIWYEELN